MITLITLLISLLGYGTPAEFDHFTEPELYEQIDIAEQNNYENSNQDGDQNSDGGVLGGWDSE